MVTIRDIAKLSGYSVSSVSRVLNNHPHVSDEARETIQQIIRDLDYTPNLVAKELSLGKTYKVGVIIPHTRHPYFTQLLNGLLDAAQASRHNILLLPSQYDQDLEIYYLEQLRGHAFDSFIFTSRSVDLDIISSYTKYGSIVCCEEVNSTNISSVYINRKPAYLDVYQYLKEKKVQSLAILLARAHPKSSTYRNTVAAYREIFGQKSEPVIIEGSNNLEDGYRIAKRLVKLDKLDCIFANGDDVAAGIIRCYNEKELDVPLIIGQENQITSQLLNISTVDNKSYQLGLETFHQAISPEPKTIQLHSTFIKR